MCFLVQNMSNFKRKHQLEEKPEGKNEKPVTATDK